MLNADTTMLSRSLHIHTVRVKTKELFQSLHIHTVRVESREVKHGLIFQYSHNIMVGQVGPHTISNW